jgi:hypothetical protein
LLICPPGRESRRLLLYSEILGCLGRSSTPSSDTLSEVTPEKLQYVQVRKRHGQEQQQR